VGVERGETNSVKTDGPVWHVVWPSKLTDESRCRLPLQGQGHQGRTYRGGGGGGAGCLRGAARPGGGLRPPTNGRSASLAWLPL
jgi:hypothetical protein